MHRFPLYITALLLCIVSAGCIKNDLPYPRIQQNILSLAVPDQTTPAEIDQNNLTATVYLPETTNPRRVTFSEFTYTTGAECSRNLLEGSYDLTEPLHLTLSLYQNYTWTINAVQHTERYFTLEGQIGETHIDVVGKRIVVYVPDTADLSRLKVTSIKLGPKGITTMTPALEADSVIDASKPLKIKVAYFGQVQEWTLYVDVTEALVTTTSADAWVNVIWAYGAAPEEADNGFQYREATSERWIDIPSSDIVKTGGVFSACIPHLRPLTKYVVRAVSDTNLGNEITVTTGTAVPLPDGSFDQWWLNGKIWCPWSQGGSPWWDTGNTGASTLGQSNVTPSDFTPAGIGQSAKLETRFVGIGAIGKLAAGSIFAGTFVKVDGTNGILDFGRPWEECPTRLKGYYNYTTSPINYANDEYKSLLGQPDTCQMWVALIDRPIPWQIRTNPKNRQLFDPTDPSVIAYGEFKSGTNSNGWQPFDIKLDYKATNRKPTYLLVVAAASKYGDFFTGGTGSVLYVDDFSLSYDY